MSLRAFVLVVLAFSQALLPRVAGPCRAAPPQAPPTLGGSGGAAPDGLDVLGDAYPRAFFFRASEGLARGGRFTYPDWEGIFNRLNGIMGKTLDEEVPGTQANNIPYFTRFKAAHPRQTVLLHFNGNARDPRWERDAFFAGHWLYHNGCRVTADVPAEAGEYTLHVEDPSLFRTSMGRYGNSNEDLGICLLGADGKPDWSQSEQLELLSVDAAAKTLRVRRGAYGTAPRAFPAGKAYVAAHVCEGPWGRKSHLLWYYNYSTACPRDAEGRNCVDVLVEDVAHRFLPGGALATFDGLEFDVLMFRVPGGSLRAPDADADGKPDGAIFDGVNTYGVGVVEFCRRLRERLGRSKLILGDGHAEANQRAFTFLNGIESEGWPSLGDPEVVDWSGGLNRHEFWRRNACQPAFSYINHKYIEPRRSPGQDEKPVQVPLSTSRLVLAAGLFTDSAFTYALAAPAAPGEKVGIYDELRMGTANRLNWLGRPSGPPIRLALRAPDLLRGAGTRWDDTLLGRLRADAARLERVERGAVLRVSSPGPGAGALAVTLPALRLPKGDLFVHLRLKADPMRGYPHEVARLAWTGWQHAGDLMRPRPLASGMALRGGKEETVRPETGATVRFQDPAEVAGASRRAYFAHPPYRGGTGYAFWETMATVPPGKPRLLFYTALSDRAKATSDGVVMKVEVRGAGNPEEVVTLHHRERQWVARSADLSRWAGKEVRLRFTVDSGPADNSIADQAYWGDVRIARDGEDAGPRPLPLTPSRVMTWMNGEWFEAGFYFRDLGPGSIDLSFEFEGDEPVLLADLTAHSATDVIVREYEKGVVLANPGATPYDFDVAELLPGRKLRRLQGSPQQDPVVNDGSAAGVRVTVGARDALFLIKE